MGKRNASCAFYRKGDAAEVHLYEINNLDFVNVANGTRADIK